MPPAQIHNCKHLSVFPCNQENTLLASLLFSGLLQMYKEMVRRGRARISFVLFTFSFYPLYSVSHNE